MNKPNKEPITMFNSADVYSAFIGGFPDHPANFPMIITFIANKFKIRGSYEVAFYFSE
jgi:hypothetical protein